MLMGYRQYARHRGVTLRAVQKAIEAGRISVDDDKKINSDTADRDWIDNTDSSRVAITITEKPQQDGPAQMPLAPPAPEVETEGDEPLASDPNAAQYREHRTTREKYQSLKQQLEYEQLAGQMINVDEAKRIVYTSFRAVRDSIMNVAARIKDQLAAEADPHACEVLLENELTAALAGIDIGKLLVDQEE